MWAGEGGGRGDWGRVHSCGNMCALGRSQQHTRARQRWQSPHRSAQAQGSAGPWHALLRADGGHASGPTDSRYATGPLTGLRPQTLDRHVLQQRVGSFVRVVALVALAGG